MKTTFKVSVVLGAGLLALMAGLGFQSTSNKFGVVDVAKVFNDSDFKKKQDDTLKAVGDSRAAILDFMENFRAFTPEQATRFRELSLKPQRTAAEQSELDKLKADVQAADAAFKQLQTKPTPTPAEVTQLQDYNARSQTTASLSQRWAREFDDEVRTMNDKMRDQTMDRIDKAIKEVSSKQGYTVVFSADLAPYGANDVTADTLKAMNAQK